MNYFLGVDIGATKTAALICDEQGQAYGYGIGGSGNPENVGYEGMQKAIQQAVTQALQEANIQINQLSGAGFGIGGFDWGSLEEDMRNAIQKAGICCPVILVNDAVLGLIAGTSEGWGVAVVSGTGCNCRGRDKDHKREGRVTGFGILMGENAGGTELVYRTMQTIGYSWAKRLPPTALSDAFVKHYHAKNLEDLIEGYTTGRYNIAAEAAPIVFQVAAQGDKIAQNLVQWAGTELGEMANAVIRQLDFQEIEFEVALIGSMFKTGEALIAPMRSKIYEIAPKAKLIPVEVKPVVGAVLLGMEAGQLPITANIRAALNSNTKVTQ
jgi:N-acetylglucosamine kinase-like BadF-type ATPase